MKQLTGEGDWAVIAIDYSASGRSIGTFAELAANLTVPLECWLGDPPEVGVDGLTISARWAAEAAALSRPILAVFGFCTGAVYAAEVADRLSAEQEHRPSILLLDPELSSDGLVMTQFAHVLDGKLAMALQGSVRSEVDEEAKSLASSHTGTELAVALGQLLRDRATPKLLELGLGERMADELCVAVSGYLSYLGGAVELAVGPAWKEAVAISSSDVGTGLQQLRADERLNTVAKEVALPVAYSELLRDPLTAEAVDDWLVAELKEFAID